MPADRSPEAPLILSPKERREQMRRDMVSAILEAARAVMRERGVAALSLREVARRVQLQAPSLYAYFPNKNALYDALFLLGVRRYGALKDRSAVELDTFWDYLHAWLTTYMQFAEEHPDLYQLAFERPVPGFTPSDASMAESQRLLGKVNLVLDEAIREGLIQPRVSVSQARDLIIAMSHGLTSQHMANEPDLPIGSGRYGSLIPAAVDLFRAAWDPNHAPDRGTSGASPDPDVS
ncbi:MAG: hypothetical protein NVSMB22_13440 [Chloroflexota bacterium]